MSSAPSPADSSTPQGSQAEELARRVLFSLMSPATKLSTLHGVSLKEMTRMMRLAHFRRQRQRGKTLDEIGLALDVSVRTAKRLSRQLKENFFAPELEHELPRRVEFMLWAAPISRARLNQVIEDAEQPEIDEALDLLEEQGRARPVEGRPGFYEATRPGAGTRLVRDDMTARIGALNALMDNVTNAIWGRFFADDPHAFARTLSFRVRPEDHEELAALYERVLWPKLRELDARVAADESAHAGATGAEAASPHEMQLSICWAPYELVDRVDDPPDR